MEDFVRLIMELGNTKSINEKQSLLATYFSKVCDQDKLWTIALFTGKKPKKVISSSLLKKWSAEFCQIPEWLFNESYHTVGDLAETIALLLPEKKGTFKKDKKLSDIILSLAILSNETEEQKKEFVINFWKASDRSSCFVFNKLITGGFRIGISQSIIYNTIANLEGLTADEVTYLFSGNWHPSGIEYKDIIHRENVVKDISKPYPFYLAYPLEADITELGLPDNWIAEWKWDGIRGQCIKRNEHHFIWSRGEELLTNQFPELEEFMSRLPNGTVIDGEILCAEPNDLLIHPLPFSLLQKRISRKKINNTILKEAPVIFVAYDLLELEHEDIRMWKLSDRKERLEDLINNIHSKYLKRSEHISFENWGHLAEFRKKSRDNATEGIMLKSKSSSYQSGRKKGDWWKWKVDPLTIDCVLVYAQKGHGRRSNLYTDYTFALKDGERLITFTKAYSGLTDQEFKEVDAFIRKNSIEKFGPVRTVKAEMVFEIAFEGISESKRHKAGIALRFPRMKRIRKDKTVEDINTIGDLRSLLRQYGQSNRQ